MPVEIFELIIRATINDDSNRTNATSASSNSSNSNDSDLTKMSEKEVTAQVIELMKRKKER